MNAHPAENDAAHAGGDLVVRSIHHGRSSGTQAGRLAEGTGVQFGSQLGQRPGGLPIHRPLRAHLRVAIRAALANPLAQLLQADGPVGFAVGSDDMIHGAPRFDLG